MTWGFVWSGSLRTCGDGDRGADRVEQRDGDCSHEFKSRTPRTIIGPVIYPETVKRSDWQENPERLAIHQQRSNLNTFQGIGGNRICSEALCTDGVG